jgi:nitrate reductase gamma subunit
LQRRLVEPALRDATAPADLFNLLFFVLAFGVALVYLLAADRDLGRSQAFVTGLVTLSPQGLGGEGAELILGTAAVLLLSTLTAYIPLTHMSHFVGKYFAYHAIRWNDTPNLRGGSQEAAIQKLLNLPVSWSATHIKGDGKKTWADVATEEQKK